MQLASQLRPLMNAIRDLIPHENFIDTCLSMQDYFLVLNMNKHDKLYLLTRAARSEELTKSSSTLASHRNSAKAKHE